MSSETEEAPLLHEPDLMLAVLRVSACKVATLDDCIRQLRTLLRVAHEPPPADPEGLRARLLEARGKLLRAGLIRGAGQDGFEITDLGRRMLEEHPDGVDESLLVRFREYRAAVAGRSAEGSVGAGAAAYDAATPSIWSAGRSPTIRILPTAGITWIGRTAGPRHATTD